MSLCVVLLSFAVCLHIRITPPTFLCLCPPRYDDIKIITLAPTPARLTQQL